MDAALTELLKIGDWVRAVEILNELLNQKNLTKHQALTYLLNRSDCFFKLGHLEAVVEDSRRVIKILDETNEGIFGSKARKGLVQALFLLKRFGEAEVVVREWVSLKDGPNQKEANKILERLHKALRSNGNSTPLQSELLAFEAKLQILSIQSKMEKDDDLQGFPCTYCGVCFNSKTELRVHCQSEIHQQIIMSDEGRDWKCRAPPRGFSTETYDLCEKWIETGVCRYGMQCVEAHGIEELNEWKMRFDYRRMKLKKAFDTELYGKSYVEELIEKLIQTTSPDKIMRENIPEVEESCSNKLAISISTKNSTQEWIFKLVTDKHLKAVGLLQDTHRNYFKIDEICVENEITGRDSIEINNPQEWILKSDATVMNIMKKYYVKIICQADIYGTFRQSVVFDFNCELILVKHLCVDVIPFTEVEKINDIRKEFFSGSERWTNKNCNIIPFTSSYKSHSSSYANLDTEWGKHLTSTYPCPQEDTFILSQATINEKRLTQNNYRGRMHELLCVEEMARFDKIAQYNISTKLRIIHSYLLAPNSMASSTAKYSSAGELFALVHLDQDLSEDSPAGRLILTNSTTVYFSPDNYDGELPNKIYEALIEDKGKSTIYLRLSASTVEDLNLVDDQELKSNIQFQLNRVPYCEWHYAIDKIPDYKIIFPETYLEPNIPWTPARQWSDTFDSRLNLKQKEAVVAITTPLYIHLPPVLVIGPFGTGKTFTLAQAIKELMLQPESRILICTQSNSAADLYIKDYLHPFVESGHEEARPLRIYFHKRWVAGVNEIVQKYCLINVTNHSRNFRLPTVEEILKHRIVVVTLSISMYLSTMDLPRGFFTHIFLDEAAQAMECEAIMPLTLANENTRIVLAGDHMQLSPELFCNFAKERSLHVSLLERLYDHYPTTFPCKILLCENYRAHEAIIQFTSESFYDQKLISSGKQPMHTTFYPLTFFTTRGEDVQDLNSTAFYNNSEVYEIVERVQELIKCWPPSWGKFGDQSIGVMTPYSDQVMRIRSELKKKRLYNISVERVLNVQGKQFRAIFLSTVRTRRTCVSIKHGEDLDYGFLSNSKLLNTAITRAQSLVAVVGDPIALCSIGRCSKVWERFIQICDENKSLFGITWLSIKNQLDGVELKKTYVLNPNAPEFIPRKNQIINMGYMLRFPLIPPPFPPAPVINPKPPLFFRAIHPTIYPIRHPVPPIQVSMPPIRNFPVIQPPQTSLPQPPDYNPKIIHTEDNNLIQFLNNVHFPELVKQQSNQNQCSLHDYINLLPQNTSLAQMLLLPFEQQEAWYHHLLENRGIEAAKKFEFLIHTTTKREADKPVLLNHASTSYVQQVMPNLNYYNKPVNQLNLNEPVYLNVDNRVGNLEKDLPLPLYKREPDVNREIKPITCAPQTERQMIEQQWKQQINADFANLSVHNGDTVDDIMQHYNNRITYASVVRAQVKPPEESRINLNLSGVNGANNLNGPRLYQHF